LDSYGHLALTFCIWSSSQPQRIFRRFDHVGLVTNTSVNVTRIRSVSINSVFYACLIHTGNSSYHRSEVEISADEPIASPTWLISADVESV
jgi:hypothetical protein